MVTRVSEDAKVRLAASAGAHHVINYRTEDPAQRIRAITPGVEIIAEVDIDANLGARPERIADYRHTVVLTFPQRSVGQCGANTSDRLRLLLVAEAAAAHQAVQSKAVGKVLIDVAADR